MCIERIKVHGLDAAAAAISYLVQVLDIHHAKDEDKLVEHKVPKFVFHVLEM